MAAVCWPIRSCAVMCGFASSARRSRSRQNYAPMARCERSERAIDSGRTGKRTGKRARPIQRPVRPGAPAAFAAALTNAVFNLSQAPNFSLPDWIEAMLVLGKECGSVESFRQAGQVAAWRGGLAHFRDGALAACQEIPPRLVQLALGLNSEGEPVPIKTLLTQLRADRWRD